MHKFATMPLLSERNTPRLLILAIDMAICVFSLLAAYQIRFNFQIPETETDSFIRVIPFVMSIRLASFLLFRTYTGIIRYTSSKDTVRILGTMAAGSGLMALSNPILYRFEGVYMVPFSIIIIDFLLSVFIMITGRIAVKELYMELKKPSGDKVNVIIFGAGEAGLITKRTLDRDTQTAFRVIAFVDDNHRKAGKKMEGVKIYPAEQLENLLGQDVKQIIIAVQKINPERKQEIIELALQHDAGVLDVPPVRSWINGALSVRQIRQVNIEDLLGRKPIRLNLDKIRQDIGGRKVLVTGAAGSIGNGLVSQILKFDPALLVLVDMAESALYDLELELKEEHLLSGDILKSIVCDIRNVQRMRSIFSSYQPDLVFHAAAYKHVPVMEVNPEEAVQNNVSGTKTIADLALEFNASKFVMISTDKAVNPTNIMGASKRIAEMYIQSMNRLGKTRFITTRFGNVLGSNGSVIPRFKKQIEKRLPVTVTDPEVTRFFMTISEACQLVLEAASMGNGGEIFIFDMGQPVRIADLAVKMIKLSGLELGKDIQIQYTGMRPGEKLYEELLATQENTMPTHHDKIMIARVIPNEFSTVNRMISELLELLSANDSMAIVGKMKEIVPEFISRNSRFERLDAVK